MYKLSEKAKKTITSYKPEYKISIALQISQSRLSAMKNGILMFKSKDNLTAKKLREFLKLSVDDFFEEI